MATTAIGVGVGVGVGGGVLLGNSICFRKTQQLSISKTSLVSVSEIGFVTSQLSGIRISYNPPKPLSAPFSPALQPVIARRICPFTGKKANRANKVSFSNHKTKKLQFVNLQYKRVWWEAGKRYVKLRLSTKALKTIEKNGLDAVAKKAGIDLRKIYRDIQSMRSGLIEPWPDIFSGHVISKSSHVLPFHSHAGSGVEKLLNR
ncbi:hypothetical protein D5086_019511 [Populus alba]|uniref:Uncharacterized protein n=1 Tax=Populus alba TaxID=43335 RepID=A0ACC4BHG4_POPAL